MAKQQINIRASDLTVRQLGILQDLWGTSQTETIAICVDRAFQKMDVSLPETEVAKSSGSATRDATIYALVDPRTDAIRYVGKTTQMLSSRLRQHLRGDNQTVYDMNPCTKWIEFLKEQGLVPHIQPLQIVPEGEWQQAEREWIEKLIREGADLLNVTNGGLDGGWRFEHDYRKLG